MEGGEGSGKNLHLREITDFEKNHFVFFATFEVWKEKQENSYINTNH